jgi:hypothetical protein
MVYLKLNCCRYPSSDNKAIRYSSSFTTF